MNYDTQGILCVQLPPGPALDSYNVYLYVYIRDNANGITQYNIDRPLKVIPNNEIIESLIDQISSNAQDSIFLNKLTNGNLQESAKGMISILDIINRNSANSTNNSTNTTNSTVYFFSKTD